MAERKAIVKRDSAQFAAVCEAVLERGAKVRFRANGLSMRPNILNEDAVTVVPVEREELRIGDVALTQGVDGLRVHRVAFSDGATGEIITRADAGQEYDAAANRVFGKVIAIERNRRMRSVAFAGQAYFYAFRSLIYQCRQAAAMRFRKLASASALFGLAILLGMLLNALRQRASHSP